MAAGRDVVIVSGVRTAVGKYGGSLKDLPPGELGAAVVREAVTRSGVEPAEVGHVVFGNVIHTETHDMYLSRVAAVNGASRSRRRRSPSTGCAGRGCRRSSRPPSWSCSATPTWPWPAGPRR